MQQTIVLAAGCFWGVEKYFSQLNGVIDIRSGYTAGNYQNPTYDLVLQHRNNDNIINHTEAVQVVYDDTIIKTLDLLQHFWELHNPTQGNRQGNDIGNNYRSGIYYTNKRQEKIAHKTKNVYQYLLNQQGLGEITTEIQELDIFYPAEDYHQQYLSKNQNGYCPNHSTGVRFSKNFYQDYALAIFGRDSEEFRVGFAKGTDSRFCQKYDLFKETAEGYFVDKFSGARLFSTADRFNSGTGWLSFYQAVGGSVLEIPDNSLGMSRIEVISKTSKAHLGHVFDGEFADTNKRRFCINASVLEFKPKT